MVSLHLENLFSISPKQGISFDDLKNASKYLPEYLRRINSKKQGFYQCVDDEDAIKKIIVYKDKQKGKFADIVVLGIGGSALGAICLQQSLLHLYENELKNNDRPKLHVLDNIDPALIREVEDVIDYKKTLFIVVTKSGTTPETISQFFYFKKKVEDNKLNAKDHFVFITDAEKGFLKKISKAEKIESFDIPDNVGGRFSVLTSVGLLPLALAGADIEGIISGAKRMRELFLSHEWDANTPFQLATVQYLMSWKDKNINVLWPYSQRLIKFADWYRQLLAESIGKSKSINGETKYIGLTPVYSLGATDQHSQNQLYNEGPNDKLIMFIEVEELGPEVVIPNLYPDEADFQYLDGVSFNELLRVEKKGTEMGLTQNDRPNITLKVDSVNPKTLGELIMLFEGAVAFLGEFLEINAFDQPGVELSKKLTKELLLKKKGGAFYVKKTSA